MADGAEIITLDSDDEADSLDAMSDQQRSKGGMVFNPANYADLMSQASHSRFMAPLMKAMIKERPTKGKSIMQGTKKFPKRPGVFPPFALFTQEHACIIVSVWPLDPRHLYYASPCRNAD